MSKTDSVPKCVGRSWAINKRAVTQSCPYGFGWFYTVRADLVSAWAVRDCSAGRHQQDLEPTPRNGACGLAQRWRVRGLGPGARNPVAWPRAMRPASSSHRLFWRSGRKAYNICLRVSDQRQESASLWLGMRISPWRRHIRRTRRWGVALFFLLGPHLPLHRGAGSDPSNTDRPWSNETRSPGQELE